MLADGPSVYAVMRDALPSVTAGAVWVQMSTVGAEWADTLTELAAKHGASPSQLALAWLLHRSPVMLPIPGTSSVSHLEDNVAAAGITLSDSEYASLEDAVG